MENGMELVPYNLEVATVEALKVKYLDVTIPPDDRIAYAYIMAGLRECREIRLAVDSWHREKKEGIVRAGKHYDTERRRVHTLLEPIENHLISVRSAEDNRKEEIKTRAEREEKARIENLQRLEAERLEGIRQWQESEDKRIKAELDAIASERRKIEAEKKALEDAKRVEKDRQERAEFERKAQERAAARAEVAAREKVEREAIEKVEREAAEAKEKEHKAAQAPDKEKLFEFARQIESINKPTVMSEEAQSILADARNAMKAVVHRIRKGADKL